MFGIRTGFITTFVYYGYNDILINRIPVFILAPEDWGFLYGEYEPGYRVTNLYGTEGGIIADKQIRLVSRRHVQDKNTSCNSSFLKRKNEAIQAIFHFSSPTSSAQFDLYTRDEVVFDVYFSGGHQVFGYRTEKNTGNRIFIEYTSCIAK